MYQQEMQMQQPMYEQTSGQSNMQETGGLQQQDEGK